MENKKIIVSEYVTCGHPDKIADTISDAILDEFLKKDPNVSAGVETMVKDNIVVIGGEINSTASIDYDKVIRNVYEDLSFPSTHNLAPEQIKIINLIGKQSPEIRSGVEENEEIGAGDQGFVVGFATNETPEYIGLGHYIAKKICNWIIKYGKKYSLGPDGKAQVIVEYSDGKAKIQNILVSVMHSDKNLDYVKDIITLAILTNSIDLDKDIHLQYINKNTYIVVNPCGAWHIGGPMSDCGVTGRKLVVDQYGGYSKIGGGAYSGKNMTKVDRSAAYMARYIAKNIVASGICDTCNVEISYMIGVPEPSSLYIKMNRNEDKIDEVIKIVKDNFCLKPACIMESLDYSIPRYKELAINGHYGYIVADDEDTVAPWEKIDKCHLFKHLRQ